jgi:cell division protein FtsW
MPKKKKKSFFNSILLRGKSDYALWVVTFLLLALGLIMVLSSSTPAALKDSKGESSYGYLLHQLRAAGVGLFFMYIASRVNITKIKPITWAIYLFFTALMIYTGFYGNEAGGARRWLYLPMLGSFQPSEMAKIGFIFVFAHYLSYVNNKKTIKKWVSGILIPILMLVPIVYGVFIKQNHLSATILIGATTIIQMFVAGVSIPQLILTLLAGAGLVLGADKLIHPNGNDGFRSDRIEAWQNPEKYATGKGFQVLQGLYAIASGGILGVGLGNSKQKYIIPEPQNDFIFAVLCEELGFLGALTVIILFVVLIWRGLTIARKSKDIYAKLVALGITVTMGLQFIINIAVVTNTIPVTGVPLPFFSYGGTALIVNLISIGLLQSVARYNNIEEE